MREVETCSILGMYKGKEVPSSCVIYRQEQLLTSYWALSTSAALPVQKGGWEGTPSAKPWELPA